MKDWRSQSHVKWDCKYHVVIVPKYRQKKFFGSRRDKIGEILRQLLYIIVVLIPKGNSGDYRGIGLMEPIWKVIEGCIERRLRILPCHETLHGGIRGKGTGTAIMELKLAQQLAYIEQTPLYSIFVDLRKAFDAMDRGRPLAILEARGVGRKTRRLVRTIWELAEMACRAGGRCGRAGGAGGAPSSCAARPPC